MTALSNVDRISYRNILLTGVVTERFNQELVFAPGEADPQFSRYHLQFSSYLHLDQSQAVAIDVFDQAPPPLASQLSTVYPSSADKCRAIQSYLSQPRGRFLYWSGNVLMLDVGNRAAYGTDTSDSALAFPAGVLTDYDNGPKPQDVNVVETAAGNIYRVRFGIRFTIQLCEGEVEPGLPLDSQVTGNPPQSAPESIVHSWSYVESKDQRFWSTKVLSGSIRVRNQYDWSNSLRWLTVPPLQSTYRRQAQRFVQSNDKLTLEYIVHDKQEYSSPPVPATDWHCRYHQSFTGPVAKEKLETVAVRLEGAPGTNKPDLVKTAFEVVRSILPSSMDPAKRGKFDLEEDLETAKRFPTSFLHHAQIIDTISDSSIELIVAFRTIIIGEKTGTTPDNSITIQNLYIDNVGIFPKIRVNDETNTGAPDPTNEDNYTHHNRLQWQQPGLFDSNTPIGIFANYIQSACGIRHGITQPYQLTQRDAQGDITEGAQTEVYGSRPGWYGANGAPAETWTTAQPVQPEDYDNQAATDLQQDSSASDTLTGNMRFPLTEVELESEYQEDHGTIVLPKANTGGAAPHVEVFSFHRPVLLRISRAVATRIGGWPRMPNPEKTLTTDDATETLLKYNVVFEEPRPEEDQRIPTYRAHALIIYSVDRSIADMTRLRTGVSPAINWDLINSANPTMVDTAKLTNEMFGGNITPPT